MDRPLPDSKTRHIFFLHRTDDPSKQLITRLKNRLQNKGYVWGDHETDFIVGVTYLQNLQKCLRSSQVIILWISKEFIESPYCMKDLECACHLFDEGIRVMPLLYNIQDHQIPDILTSLIFLDVSGHECEWMDKLFHSLHKHICANDDTEVTPNEEASTLFQKFETMSAQAKSIFARTYSAKMLPSGIRGLENTNVSSNVNKLHFRPKLSMIGRTLSV